MLVNPHSEFEKYKLVHVHIVTRHGDRTPTSSNLQLGYPKVDYQCGLSGAVHASEKWANHKAVLWESLDDFPPLATVGSVKNAMLRLHPGDESCQAGDLTSQGFLQHHNLGTLMQMTYGELFAGMDIKTDMYVQSTDFRRTIRSAGAFLLGFVPKVQQLRELVQIHIQPGNLNQAPPITVPQTYKPCRKVVQLRGAENNKRGYYKQEREFHWMFDEIVDLFSHRIRPDAPWTELFDKIMTRGCHSPYILPCTKDNTCIGCELGKKMFDYADWSMSEKYALNASCVAATPFIKHSLLDPMARIVSEDMFTKYKIMLTFTHDSTMNQLLKALGMSVREWMPFASRLSFELWRATDITSDTPHYFVRVLFNGKIVTHTLPFSDKEDKELVYYSIWENNIVPLTVQTYNQQCGI